jgi:hypothetical protein
MLMITLKVPTKGFTKRERAWLELVVEAILTAQALKGKNTTMDEHHGKGTVINAQQT